jgi:hypothetical protein
VLLCSPSFLLRSELTNEGGPVFGAQNGPCTFVRETTPMSRGGFFPPNEKVDGYVLTRMTLSTRGRVASSNNRSVQLRSLSSSKSVVHASLLEISPRDIWDASRLAFLNCDDQPFQGYFKLNGRRLYDARPGFEDFGWHFYLAWGRLLLGNIDTGRYRETV